MGSERFFRCSLRGLLVFPSVPVFGVGRITLVTELPGRENPYLINARVPIISIVRDLYLLCSGLWPTAGLVTLQR